MTRPTPRSLFALAATAALAACSSGGGGGGGGTPDPDPSAFGAYFSEFLGMAEEHMDADYTAPDDHPSSSVGYQGVLTLADEDDYAVAGRLDLTVGFDTNAIDGTVTDIVGIDGTEFDGQLVIDNGGVDPSLDPWASWTHWADLGGTLSGGGETFDVAGGLNGNFVGPGAEVAGGEAWVEACTEAFDCTWLEGGYIAELQP